MGSQLLIGCSGWNYPYPPDRGGWLNVSILIQRHEN